MIVRCTQCNSAFSVDDEKVNDKRFAFTCPNCTTENVIDNRKEAPESEPVEEPVSGDFIAEGGDFTESPEEFEQEPRLEEETADVFSDEPVTDGDGDVSEESSETGDIPLDDIGLDMEDFPPIEETPDSAPETELSFDEFEEPEATDEKQDYAPDAGEPLEPEAPVDDESGIMGLMDIVDTDESAGKDQASGTDGDGMPGPGETAAGQEGELPRETLMSDFEDIDLDDIGAEIKDTVEEEIDLLSDGAVGVAEQEGDIDFNEPLMDVTMEELPEPLIVQEDEVSAGGEDLPDIPEDLDSLMEEVEGTEDFEPLDAAAVSAPEGGEVAIDSEITSEELYSREDEDESITIDLDTLDIELEDDDEEEETATDAHVPEENIDIDLGELESPEFADISAEVEGGEDEAITLDLDSLDIELAEEETIKEGEKPDDLMEGVSYIEDEVPGENATEIDDFLPVEEDEDITLDLDSLDIPLAESEEIRQGESLDEDEKLTLEDAGLTLDELTVDEMVSLSGGMDESEEDIKLTIDEIDPTLDLDAIEREAGSPEEPSTLLSNEDELIINDEDLAPDPDIRRMEEDSLEEQDAMLTSEDELIINEVDELPEIDIDGYFEEELPGEPVADAVQSDIEEMIDIDISGNEYDYDEYDDLEDSQRKLPDMVPRGSVNFSIDYSLKYSRLSALLRLAGLYIVGLLPHFLVFIVYSVLSLILGMINHLVVMFTGEVVEDFAEIQEKTLRYLLSINVSAIGIVEEMPVFTGRNDIDYALQMDVTYPFRHSRILALLRLSVAGIFITVLPHLLVLVVLNLAIPIFYLVGVISILVTARWPHFLFDFLTKYFRYLARVLAFTIGLVDVYPPFTFD